MKKIFNALALAACSALVITACQPDYTPELPTTTPPTTLSSKDPLALSKAMKVWHGVRTNGTMPAASGSGLSIRGEATHFAFSGRIAIIQPEILSGEVQGYYVSVAGAGEFFKVDYTRPRDLPGRTALPGIRSNPISYTSRRSGIADSAIVLRLPTNLTVPDTVCVTYSAYSATGVVSPPVTTCIIISSLGTTAEGAWIQGTWKYTAVKEGTVTTDTIIHNKWIPNPHVFWYCNRDSASGINYVSPDIQPGSMLLVKDSMYWRKAQETFSADGNSLQEINFDEKHLSYTASSCTSLSWDPTENTEDNTPAVWSYNPVTKRMLVLYEYDEMGLPVMDFYEYRVEKITNNHMLLIDDYDPTDLYIYRMQR